MTAVAAVTALMVALLLIGVPVAVATGVAGAIGLYWVQGADVVIGLIASSPYRNTAAWLLTAIPLFILMAEMLAQSRVTTMLFDSANRWVSHLPGGLAISTVIASAGLGAILGSSTASTAALTQSVVPELLRHGYARAFALGTVAAAGTLAIMIPPSVILVIYGIMTEQSIGKLFIAGIIPGLLTALGYVVTILAWVHYAPQIAPRAALHSWHERFSGLNGVWPMLVLFVLVIGGIYSGVTTVTESAALGAAGAIALAALSMRAAVIPALSAALGKTVNTTAMIFAIIVGASMFGFFLTMTGVAQGLLEFVGALGWPPALLLVVVLVIYLILGCIMDQLAILVLTIPISYPMLTQLGYDPIWIGIIITKTVEIGLITPPVGMNAFVASSISGARAEEVFRGTGPFVITEIVLLVLLAMFPGMVTWVNTVN